MTEREDGRLRPTTRERIESLDVLRGFAVLGILMVNVQAFGMPSMAYQNPVVAPFPLEGAGLAVWQATHVFFDSKFITLFSILFGASIYMVGGERGDKDRGALLRRRMTWLLIFGLMHGLLLWYGDILFLYALCGFVVMLARSWAPRRLVIVGLVLIAFGAALSFGSMAMLAFAPADVVAEVEREAWLPPPDIVQAEIDAYQGGLRSALAANFSSWQMLQIFVAALLLFWRTLGVMMIGMALFKWGVLQGRRSTAFYLLLIALGAAALTGIFLETEHAIASGFDFMTAGVRGAFVNYALSPFAALGYLGALILLLRTPLFKAPAAVLAATGRMAFTNYIAQTLIMTTIFWGGRGFGLFGEIDRPVQFGLVLMVWALQLVWSPLWLSRFRMGPLEWGWRALAYKEAPALRRDR